MNILILINMAGFEQLMTSEEKNRLYAAIGYSETAVDPTLPITVGTIWFIVWF